MQKQHKHSAKHGCCSNPMFFVIKDALSKSFVENFHKGLENRSKHKGHQQHSHDLHEKNHHQKQEKKQEHDKQGNHGKILATHIVYAKKIYSMTDGEFDKYDMDQNYGMALDGQKILAIGTEKQIQGKFYSQNISIYKDKIILPGLIDAHNHFFYSFMNFDEFVDMNMREGESGQQAYKRIWQNLQQKVKQVNLENMKRPLGKKQWVFARDYDKLRTFEGQLSLESIEQSQKKLQIQNLNILGDVNLLQDEHLLHSNTPIFILEANTHIAHLNLAAFEQAGLDYNHPQNITQPQGGTVVIDKQTNQLTGLLIQPPAVSLFVSFFPKSTNEQFLQNIQSLFQKALQKGCTSMHDGGIGSFTANIQDHYNMLINLKNSLDIFSKIRLSILITIDLWKLGVQNGSNASYSRPNLSQGDNLKQFRITGVKMWNDGSIQGGSGLLEKPYKLQDGVLWNSTRETIPIQALYQKLREIIKDGWPVAIHCNGDQAFRRAIKAICDVEDELKQLPLPYRIHRIEHSTLIKQQDLDVIVKRRNQRFTIHPSFLIGYLPKYGQVYKDILLADKVAQTEMDLVGSSLRKGLEPSIHSDWMMSEINPLSFIESCVNRKMVNNQALNQQERVTVLQALKIVTLYAAKACYCEDIVGSLTPKKLADFIVLDTTPQKFESGIGLKQLSLKGVEETWVNGKRVFPL